MSWRRIPFTMTSLVVLVVGAVATGCSPKTPLLCDPFIGCPVRKTSGPSPVVDAAPTSGSADFALAGTLASESGLVAEIDSRLWLGQPRMTPSPPRQASWVHVDVPVSGSVTITNVGPDPNAAAVSVDYSYWAGYPRDSEVCRLAEQAGDTGRFVGNHCWQLIGEASFFSYATGQASPVPPQQSRVAPIGADSTVSIDVPVDEANKSVEVLRHPEIVVAWTREIVGAPSSFRFRNACTVTANIPSAPTGPQHAVREQRVQVGASASVACEDVPW